MFARLVGLQEAIKHLGRPGADKHCCYDGVPAGAVQVGEQGAQEGVVWGLVPGFGLIWLLLELVQNLQFKIYQYCFFSQLGTAAT